MSLLKLIETGKVSNTVIFLVVIVSATLLFATPDFIIRLTMVEFMKYYGKWVGIAFLVSSALLIIVLLAWIWREIEGKWQDRKYKKYILTNIKSMDFDEQAIVREILFNASTLALPFTNPSVASLSSKRIIYQVGNHGGMNYGEPCLNYTLTKTARTSITFPMIGLGDEQGSQLSEHAKRFINDNRPLYE